MDPRTHGATMGRGSFSVRGALLLAALLPLKAFGQDAAPLSLTDCVRLVLDRSPDLAAAAERLREARAQWGKALSAFSPQGNLIGNQIALGQDLTGALNRGDRWDNNTRTASLQATWNVFNGFRDWDKLKGAKYDLSASSEALAAVHEQLILQTVQSYYGLLLAQKSLEAQQEDLRSKREHYQLADARFKKGLRSYSDVLNAQIEMKQSEIGAINAQSARSTALYALNILLDAPLTSPTAIVDELAVVPAPESLERSLTAAFEQRPEMRQAQDQARSAMAGRDFALHDALPSVSVSGTYGYNLTSQGLAQAVSPGSGATILPGPNPFWQVNVGLSVPIWDGGAAVSEIARTRAAAREAEANLARQRRVVEKDVTDAHLSLETNRRVYEVAKDQVDAAREDLKIVTERYRNGSASVLDVVDAQANLLRVQIASIQSLYNLHIATFALKRATGLPLF